MIVEKINNQPNIPEYLQGYVETATLNEDNETYNIKLKDIKWFTISKFQFEAELEERGLHDTVMGMLEQLAQSDMKIEIWLRTGTTIFRWSEKVISLANALKDNGVDIDLDEFFEKAKQHSL